MKHTPTIVLTPTTTDVAFPMWKYEIQYNGEVWEESDFVFSSVKKAASAADQTYYIRVRQAHEEAKSYDF